MIADKQQTRPCPLVDCSLAELQSYWSWSSEVGGGRISSDRLREVEIAKSFNVVRIIQCSVVFFSLGGMKWGLVSWYTGTRKWVKPDKIRNVLHPKISLQCTMKVNIKLIFLLAIFLSQGFALYTHIVGHHLLLHDGVY
jgi:hypothetical protein